MNAKKKKDKHKAHRPAETAHSRESGVKGGHQGAAAKAEGPGQRPQGHGAQGATFGTEKAKASTKEGSVKASGFAFGPENYKLLLIGLAFLVAGFLLMIGGGAGDRTEQVSKSEPGAGGNRAKILLLIGYVIEIFAIMKKPKD